MPTRKLRDLVPDQTCTHPEHEPPRHRVYSDGVYEHICPGCGRRVEFTIRRPRWLGALLDRGHRLSDVVKAKPFIPGREAHYHAECQHWCVGQACDPARLGTERCRKCRTQAFNASR